MKREAKNLKKDSIESEIDLIKTDSICFFILVRFFAALRMTEIFRMKEIFRIIQIDSIESKKIDSMKFFKNYLKIYRFIAI